MDCKRKSSDGNLDNSTRGYSDKKFKSEQYDSHDEVENDMKFKSEQYDSHDEVETDWSLDENKMLLEVVASLTNKKGDVSYKRKLMKLDFLKVAEKMNRTSEECRCQFDLLIKKVNKIKTMKCLISDTLSHLCQKENYIENGYLKFMKEKHDVINSELDSHGLDSTARFKVVSNLWKDLNKEEKQKYMQLGVKSKNEDKPTTYSSSFDLFMKKIREKDPSISYNECRLHYKNLDLNKKFEFIEESLRDINKGESLKISQFKDKHPGEEPIIKLSFPMPTKEETKYYLQCIGMPNIPPKLPAIFFAKETKLCDKDLGSKFLMEASLHFKNLNADQQKHWTSQLGLAWKNYEIDMDSWINKQNIIVKELVKRTIEFSTSFLIKQETTPLKEVEMPTGKVHFDNEPDLNFPITALKVYSERLKTKGIVTDHSNLKLQFKMLPKDQQKELQSSATRIKQKYISLLHQYVDALSIEWRKKYLGVRRKKIMAILKEDIFRHRYPDEEYPVYTKKCEMLSNKFKK